jgi:hypothetical protein
MTIRDWMLKRLAAPPAEKPMTYPGKTGGIAPSYFGKREGMLPKYRTIYEQGGPVSEGVDCYPLMMFSNGYRIEGPRKEGAEELMDDLDFETVGWKLVVDALVVKLGLAEIQAGLEPKKYPIAKLEHRYPETFDEVKDDYGTLLGYKQSASKFLRPIDVPPEKMFRLDLGLPLIERAYDDIQRDVMVASGTAKSIERHGFPRHHITVGQSGAMTQQTDIDSIAKMFEDLKPQHEMATCADVPITNIDSQGVQNAKLYNEWATQRMAAALGVPEEMLGLGRGVLTGEVRAEAFYAKIGTLQKRFARQWNTQIFDRWAIATGGKAGDAWLVFNDVSATDESKAADLIQKLMTGPIDPWQIVTPEWCRARLDIDEADYQKWYDAQGKIDAEQARASTPTQLLPFTGKEQVPAEKPQEVAKQ